MKLKYTDYQSTEDFLTAVAKRCVSELTDEDKQLLCEKADPSAYHFSIGLYIRNEFIRPQKKFESADNHADVFDLIARADDHSDTVVKLIIDLLKK